MSHWPWWTPIIAIIVVIAASTMTLDTTLVVVCAVALVGAVIASVHHAEVVAHRIGEPLGTVVLSICVTVIEVALITDGDARRRPTWQRCRATPSTP